MTTDEQQQPAQAVDVFTGFRLEGYIVQRTNDPVSKQDIFDVREIERLSRSISASTMILHGCFRTKSWKTSRNLWSPRRFGL
jgi:hypothetical protein